jgi:hypothetical protein
MRCQCHAPPIYSEDRMNTGYDGDSWENMKLQLAPYNCRKFVTDCHRIAFGAQAPVNCIRYHFSFNHHQLPGNFCAAFAYEFMS